MDTTQFRNKTAIRAYIAEFLGTMFLLFAGVGTACSSAYASRSHVRDDSFMATDMATDMVTNMAINIAFDPDLPMVLTIAFAFGMAFMVLVYGTTHISGGHLNPAITLSMVIFREIDPLRGVLYIVSQVLGASVGVLLVHLMWPSAVSATVGLSANAVIPALSLAQAFFLEFFGTALLCFTFFNTSVDPHGINFNTNLAPLAIGFSVFLAHVVLIPLTGCGINPARTFGAALISGNWNHHWLFWIA
ncbi:hypothetical protein SARC_12801, partial [Sphaeroforma arctica JP610]